MSPLFQAKLAALWALAFAGRLTVDETRNVAFIDKRTYVLDNGKAIVGSLGPENVTVGGAYFGGDGPEREAVKTLIAWLSAAAMIDEATAEKVLAVSA